MLLMVNACQAGVSIRIDLRMYSSSLRLCCGRGRQSTDVSCRMCASDSVHVGMWPCEDGNSAHRLSRPFRHRHLLLSAECCQHHHGLVLDRAEEECCVFVSGCCAASRFLAGSGGRWRAGRSYWMAIRILYRHDSEYHHSVHGRMEVAEEPKGRDARNLEPVGLRCRLDWGSLGEFVARDALIRLCVSAYRGIARKLEG